MDRLCGVADIKSIDTRGNYQWPQQLNTGEDYTPGHRLLSSYDNNMASWTMPGEYGLKKDRDRQFFTGEFLWSGFDYIGEPTPYNQFPVKSSFFGAVDTAGFPKDLFYAFASQWTTSPMVHLVPMNWTDHAPGESVAVWAYAQCRGRRAVPQRRLARGSAIRPQDDDLRDRAAAVTNLQLIQNRLVAANSNAIRARAA